MKAAARSYFGINDLSELTPAQAAVLAALPKSPSNYDLVRNAVEECLEPGENEGECAKTQLVVPPDTTVVERRNQILTLMAEDDRTPMSDGQYTSEELLAARDEPVVLVPQTTERWQAPHFVWRVRDELFTKLCGEDATCPQLDRGGLRITTTLDLEVQKTAEKWVKAAAVVPFQDNPRQAAKRLGLKYEDWMANLADKRLRNGALVAMDYQTGELIAYVGSADYYSTKHNEALPAEVRRGRERLPPAGFGVQAVQLRDRDRLRQAHGRHRADGRRHRLRQRLHAQRRRPPRARTADRPKRAAVLAQHPVGQGPAGQRPGHGLRSARRSSGCASGATRAMPACRWRSAPRRRRRSTSSPATPRSPTAAATSGTRRSSRSRTAAARTSSIRTSRPSRHRSSARRRPTSPRTSWPATRTATSTRSGASSRFEALTASAGRPRSRPARTTTPRTSTPTATSPRRPASSARTGSTRWSSERGTATATTARSARPTIRCSRSRSSTLRLAGLPPGDDQGLADPQLPAARGRPGPGRRSTRSPATCRSAATRASRSGSSSGTEPKNRLPREACGRDVLELLAYESKFDNWLEWDRDWLRRARRGPGTVGGPDRTRVTYFYNNGFNPFGRAWGPVMGQNCAEPTPEPSCVPLPTPDASGVIPSFELPEPSGDAPALVACPPESATPEPSAPPSEEPSPPPSGTDARTGARHRRPNRTRRRHPSRRRPPTPTPRARQPRPAAALIEAGGVTIELAGVTVTPRRADDPRTARLDRPSG